jgi:hypothetical protein
MAAFDQSGHEPILTSGLPTAGADCYHRVS